jgi:hypothetical protein
MNELIAAQVSWRIRHVVPAVAIALGSHHWTPIAPTLAARGLGEHGNTRRVPA